MTVCIICHNSTAIRAKDMCNRCYRKNYYENNRERYQAHWKTYYEEHKEERKAYSLYLYHNVFKEGYKANHRLYWNEHKDEINKERREDYENRKEFYINQSKDWQKRNPDKMEIYRKRGYEKKKLREKTDEQFFLRRRLSSRISSTIKYYGGKKDSKTLEILGAKNIKIVKEHFEKSFLPGMSWEKRNFHIHHIMPCYLFDLTKDEEIKKCYNYKNLTPVTPLYNLQMGIRIFFPDEIIKKMLNHIERIFFPDEIVEKMKL